MLPHLDLDHYVLTQGLREHELLASLRAETAALPQARMQITPVQGQLLAFLVKLIGARRCLEIGVFTGYSSLAVALALPADGSLVACERDPVATAIAQRYWQAAGVASKIDLRLAPALETLATLSTNSFDFAFIDADKRNTKAYYEHCVGLVRPGGLIAIDNTLWSGRVLEEASDDRRTLAIQAFNRHVHADDRVDMLLLPVADGLTLVRRRESTSLPSNSPLHADQP